MAVVDQGRLHTQFLRPSIRVRTSFEFGHEIDQSAQWRLVPQADPCSARADRPVESIDGIKPYPPESPQGRGYGRIVVV